VLPVYFYVDSGLRVPQLRGLYSELELADGRRVPNLQGIHPLRALYIEGSAAAQGQSAAHGSDPGGRQ
jgi:hypothetical protein